MKLVMTLLVRDEEDILSANFEYHLQQGVDFFIVTDNLSVDGTRDIIERYVRAGVACYLNESNDNYAQHKWVTRMAQMAAEKYGADWVVNNDADELWLPSEQDTTLKEVLGSTPSSVQVIQVQRFNFVPSQYERRPDPVLHMTLRERESKSIFGMPLPPKVVHRAASDITIAQGNHAVLLHGQEIRPILGPLKIFHYPLRSYAQFENKIRKGGLAYERNSELSDDVGATWRALYRRWQAGTLPDYFNKQMRSPDEIEDGIATGDLIRDLTVIEILHQAGRDRRVGTL